ncbi:MAG: hypothetical protein PHP73_07360 [Candidatus Omnitrophica bacterium]|nr:hypothetical protein [Candidatus Omnitrophota bacterium]
MGNENCILYLVLSIKYENDKWKLEIRSLTLAEIEKQEINLNRHSELDSESGGKCLKCVRRLKRKNIKRFKRFKPQAFQAPSFKADPIRQLAD